MKELKRKYLKLLMVELEDAVEDLETLLDLNSSKRDKGQITNYVYMENVSLLQHEIACINDLMGYCDSVDLGQPADLKELTELFCRCLTDRARKNDYPQAVSYLVDRKMKKIADYLALE